MAARAARAPRALVVRVRHRRPDGELTALAAARHHVLAQAGWDVEQRRPDRRAADPGRRRREAPRHDRPRAAAARPRRADRRRSGRRPGPDASPPSSRLGDEPTIVCAQAGEVNTGAFDPFDAIADARDAAGNAWVHVDGAFGLWAAASPTPAAARRRRRARRLVGDRRAQVAERPLRLRHRVHARIPSRTAPRSSARAATSSSTTTTRDQVDWNPEHSRRARGFAVYAAIRSLGRSGIAELVERCCAHAQRFADGLARARRRGAERRRAEPGAVPVRDRRARPTRSLARVQASGEAWMSGTTWDGRARDPHLGLELADDARTTTRDVDGFRPRYAGQAPAR